MKELNFQTGLVTYNVNGVCEITFNPTDVAFVEKMYSSFDELKAQQDGFESVPENEPEKVFEFAKNVDRKMREIIDGIFEKPVCDALFPNINVYAMADGMPVWFNFIVAIFDEIDSATEAEHKKSDDRIKKYTSKYKKK